MRISGIGVFFLLEVGDATCGAAAVDPHADLLVGNPLVRIAVAVDLGAWVDSGTASLTLNKSGVVDVGGESGSDRREEQQGKEGDEEVGEGLHGEGRVLWRGRRGRVLVVVYYSERELLLVRVR